MLVTPAPCRPAGLSPLSRPPIQGVYPQLQKKKNGPGGGTPNKHEAPKKKNHPHSSGFTVFEGEILVALLHVLFFWQ